MNTDDALERHALSCFRNHDGITREIERRAITDAQQLGELPSNPDAARLAFELDALACAANAEALLFDDDSAYDRAAAAIHDRLHALV
ncbi:TetR family transcriptional regulator C-terminal domain-containing protein [Antrihabitans cavernicola]|uniref:Tetracyclin repressor-like C-terminal domain-containing protein n=1 Tax=Antrihabitans cavernicola TaxID=2495913 RepID=A0A5A7S3C7_9NOCA|nr:hypothetical protein [Spelaeibacter cavernicola]KAA0019395.1 hypothetical protein FOY51_22355 [Spelaeibacter cavernicola]